MRWDRSALADRPEHSQFLTFPAHQGVMTGCSYRPVACSEPNPKPACLPATAWNAYRSTLHIKKDNAWSDATESSSLAWEFWRQMELASTPFGNHLWRGRAASGRSLSLMPADSKAGSPAKLKASIRCIIWTLIGSQSGWRGIHNLLTPQPRWLWRTRILIPNCKGLRPFCRSVLA